MTWPEAIFYSVLAICGLVGFLILLGIVLLLNAFSSPRRQVEPTPDYRWVSWTTRPAPKPSQWRYEKVTTPRTTVQPETDIDSTKMPGKGKEGGA